jgi:hypothetical protein
MGFVPAYCFTNGRRVSRGLEGRLNEVKPRVVISWQPLAVTEILESFISGREVAWFRIADIKERTGCVGATDASIKVWSLD